MNKQNDQKTAELERLWKELIGASPSAEHLASVARLVLPLRERAWQAYCDTNPSQSTLLLMVTRSVEWQGLRRYPAKELIRRYPDTLWLLLEEVEEVLTEAAEGLLATNPDREALARMLRSVTRDESIRKTVAEKLLAKSPNGRQLGCILSYVPEYREEAGKRLLQELVLDEDIIVLLLGRVPTSLPEVLTKYKECLSERVLLTAIGCKSPAAEKAAEMLIAKASTFWSLFSVFKDFPTLREKAWERIRSFKLHENQFRAIEREVPEYTEKARTLFAPPPRTEETIFHEILSANPN